MIPGLGASVYDRAILSQILKPWAQQAVRPSHPRIFLCQAACVQLGCVRETVPKRGVLQAAQSSLGCAARQAGPGLTLTPPVLEEQTWQNQECPSVETLLTPLPGYLDHPFWR